MSERDRLIALWDELMEYHGVSEQTLQVVTDINGYNEQVFYDILFAVSGERHFRLDKEEEANDD